MTDPAPEPPPEPAPNGGGRFVLHRVGGRVAINWILGVQHGDRLVRWSLPHERTDQRFAPRQVVQVPDRPLEVAFYEGPDPGDPSGVTEITVYDRGEATVGRWDADEVRVSLHGCVLCGEYRLTPIAEGQWQLERLGDPEHPPAPWSGAPTPMQAAPLELDDDVNWAFEPCWPGLRAMYDLHDGHVAVRDVDGTDRVGSLGELTGLGSAVDSDRLLLDGVVVVLDGERHPDRDVLDERLAGGNDAPVVYVAFDLLRSGDEDLAGLPLWYRRQRLETLDLADAHWLTTPQWDDTFLASALEAVASHGMSTVVAKRRGSPYLAAQPGTPWRRITA